MSGRDGVSIGLLGPLMVNGSLWGMRSEQWRIVLAVLAMNAGAVVTYDALILALWGEHPPSSPVKAVQSLVERMQSDLERYGVHIRNQPRVGYWLDIAAEDVDAEVFADLCGKGRELAESGSWAEAIDVLRQAVRLWRADPFLHIDCLDLETESQALWRLRVQAGVDLARAHLHLGRHEYVIPRLIRLIRKQPSEEFLWALLMLAQYRSGRRRDALATYARARAVLETEFDAEPGETIELIHRQIRSRVPAAEIAVP